MTNNEIIKFLQSKQIPQCGDKVYTADEEYEAYQRAIDALEQEPCERFEWGIDGNVYKITKAKDGKEICQQVCNDAISRDAVCEIVSDIRDCISVEGYCVILERLKKLPPVTAQQKTGHWTNGDCICPCCGEDKFKDLDADIWSDWQPKYCPNCGAAMTKLESEE